jgi:hypothetical protein
MVKYRVTASNTIAKPNTVLRISPVPVSAPRFMLTTATLSSYGNARWAKDV